MVDDHIRAEVAQVEARGRADPRDIFAAQRFIERLEILPDDFAALLAAVGIVAARAGADEEEFLAWGSHGGGPMRRMRVAKNTSRRKRSKAAISASIAPLNKIAPSLLTANLTHALMKSDAITKHISSAEVVPRVIAW